MHLFPAVDGVEVAVHELGGHGPPLVLVHAAGFHGRVLAPLAAHMAGHVRCVALDERGHGDTALAAGRALDWYGLADDVLAVVDGLGLSRPFAFGHSSGATAVLMAEQARPGAFSAVYCFEPIILEAGPAGDDTGRRLAGGARRRRDSFPTLDDAYRHYAGRPPLSGLAPEALRAYVDHGFADDGRGGVRLKCRPEVEAAVYETATGHDASARLAEITCPVTVACGSESDACPPELASAHARRLPAGRAEVVAGIGHFGPMERPDLVASSVRRFVLGLGAGTAPPT